MINLLYNQTQVQIDDELYTLVGLYIKRHNITIEDFAKLVNTEAYSLRKALDRKIKMHVFPTLVETIESVVKYGKK